MDLSQLNLLKMVKYGQLKNEEYEVPLATMIPTHETKTSFENNDGLHTLYDGWANKETNY